MNKIKFATLSLFLYLNPILGFAQVISSVSPSNSTPAPSETITADIVIDMTGSSELLGSFTGSVEWDPTVLSYDSNSGMQGGFTGLVNTDNSATGSLGFNGINAGGGSGTLTVLTVTFNVIGAHESSTTLDVDFSAMSAALTFVNLLPVLTVNDATVTVMDPAVPVELSSFTAMNEGNQIRLEWTTQSESNNLGFDVERSSDQESFSKLGFVPGNFTTSTPKFYTFVDSELNVGTYFYRLKQIDTNGTFEYSPIVGATVSAPAAFMLHQNFPNPFNLETVISYELAEKTEVSIFIFNLLGRKTRTLVDEVNGPGSFEIAWDGKDERGRIAPSGIYFVQMRVGEIVQFKKVTLSK